LHWQYALVAVGQKGTGVDMKPHVFIPIIHVTYFHGLDIDKGEDYGISDTDGFN
jgi:hypothetical protein